MTIIHIYAAKYPPELYNPSTTARQLQQQQTLRYQRITYGK